MIILGTNSIKDTGYNVDNSCRFDDAGSDYLRTSGFGTPTSSRKMTISFWTKRANLGINTRTISATATGSQRDSFMFNTADQILFFLDNDVPCNLKTNRLFRDTGAWYHIVIAMDTTQGTASNRVKIYVNGVQETSFATETYPDQNYDILGFGQNKEQTIGADNSGGGSNEVYPGYMAEFCFIDGTQNAVTDFGEFHEDSGIWKPIDVSGLTFGNNGFYLDFESSGSLGADVSGNSNNFTVNNLTAIDQSTDTCTNNFATMNSLDNYYASTTFSEGNLKLVTPNPSGWNATNTATMGVSSGKWYWELLISTDNDVALYGIKSGVATGEANYLTETTANGDLGYGIVTTSGNMGYPNGQSESYGATIDAGDIMMFALDMDNLKFYFGKGGTWGNSGNPATGSNGYTITAPPSGLYFPAGANFVTETVSYNFGSPSFAISSGNTDGDGYGNFEYAVPSGYFALCTKNLAEYG